MGELARRIRAKYPDAYKSLSDDALEMAVLEKYGDSEPKYKELADPKNRIAYQNKAVGRADAGVQAASRLAPSIEKNFVEKAADAAHPVLEPLSAPVTGLGMIADLVQTGGKNIRIAPKGQELEGVTGFLTGGAHLDKTLPAQAVDTLRRRVALSTTPFQPDPSKGNIENLLAGLGHSVGAATGIGLGGLGIGTGEIPGEEKHVRQNFDKQHKNLAIAEAVAEPVAEMGAAMVLDPAMAGMSALGGISRAGAASQAALKSGMAMTPEMATQAIALANRGRIAGVGAGALGAAFIPGMSSGGGTGVGESIASMEAAPGKGMPSGSIAAMLEAGRRVATGEADPASARQLSQGMMDLGFAGMAGSHLYQGTTGKTLTQSLREIKDADFKLRYPEPKPPAQAAPEGQEPPKSMMERVQEQAAKDLQTRRTSDPEPEANKPAATQGRERRMGPVTVTPQGDVKLMGINIPAGEVAGVALGSALGGPAGAVVGGGLGHTAGLATKWGIRRFFGGVGRKAQRAVVNAARENKPAGSVGTPDPALTVPAGPAPRSSDTLRQGAPVVEGVPTTLEPPPIERVSTVPSAPGGPAMSTSMGQMSVPMPRGAATTPALDPIREAKKVDLIKTLRQMTTRNQGESLADFNARVAEAAERMLSAEESKIAPPPRRVMSASRTPEQIAADRAEIEAAKARMSGGRPPEPPAAAAPVPVEPPPQGPPPAPAAAAAALPTAANARMSEGEVAALGGKKPSRKIAEKAAAAKAEVPKPAGEADLLQQMKDAVERVEKQKRPEFQKVMADYEANKLKGIERKPENDQRARAIAFKAATKAMEAERNRAEGEKIQEKLEASVAATKGEDKGAPAVRPRTVVILSGDAAGKLGEVVAQRQAPVAEGAGRGRRANEYKVRMPDGTEVWYHAKDLRNALSSERKAATKPAEKPTEKPAEKPAEPTKTPIEAAQENLAPAKWYHKDHSLTEKHASQAEKALRDKGLGFHVVEVKVDEPLPSALYGPAAGDAPIAEGDVVRQKRGDRAEPSRMVRRPNRPSNTMTVIGKNTPEGTEIYTAYGGPLAPREPWDPSLSPAEKAEATKFWEEHALATGEEAPAPAPKAPGATVVAGIEIVPGRGGEARYGNLKVGDKWDTGYKIAKDVFYENRTDVPPDTIVEVGKDGSVTVSQKPPKPAAKAPEKAPAAAPAAPQKAQEAPKAPEAQKSAPVAPEGTEGFSPAKQIKALLEANDYEKAASVARAHAAKGDLDRADSKGRKIGDRIGDSIIVAFDADGYPEIISRPRPKAAGGKKDFSVAPDLSTYGTQELLDIMRDPDAPMEWKEAARAELPKVPPDTKGMFGYRFDEASGKVKPRGMRSLEGQARAEARKAGKKPWEAEVSDAEAAQIIEERNRPEEGWVENPTPEEVARRWEEEPPTPYQRALADEQGAPKERSRTETVPDDERPPYMYDKDYSVGRADDKSFWGLQAEKGKREGLEVKRRSGAAYGREGYGVEIRDPETGRVYRGHAPNNGASSVVAKELINQALAERGKPDIKEGDRVLYNGHPATVVGVTRNGYGKAPVYGVNDLRDGGATVWVDGWKQAKSARPSELTLEGKEKDYSIEDRFAEQGVKGPKSADRELLRTMTAGQTKDVGPGPEATYQAPGIRKLKPGQAGPGVAESTPPDPRTVRPFAEGEYTAAEARAEARLHGSKGERGYGVDEAGKPVGRKVTGKDIERELPWAKGNMAREGGDYVIQTASGRTIRIRPEKTIELDFEALEQAYTPAEIAEFKANPDKYAAHGMTQTVNGEALVRIVKAGKLGHELTHVAARHFATAREWAAFEKKYKGLDQTQIGEKLARAYEELDARLKANPEWQPTNTVGRVLKRVHDFFNDIYRAWRPNEESFLRQVRSGKVFERQGRADTGLAKSNYSMGEGPRGAGSPLGRMLDAAEGLRRGPKVGKGAIYEQSKFTKPRIAKGKNALETAKATGKMATDKNTVATDGAYAPKDYSVDTVEETIRSAEDYNAKTKEFDAEQMSNFAKNLRSVAAAIHAAPERLGFKALKGAKVLKANGDPRYPVSQDFTTNCRRRYALRDTIDAIVSARQKLFGADKAMLGPDEIMQVREALRKKGKEVNCGPCYVESRRINLETAVNKAIEGYMFKQGESEVFRQLTPENAIRALTQAGRDWMFENDPAQYDVMSGALAGSNIKAPLGRAEYIDEYLKLSQETIDKMNQYSGARSQSWSDMEVPHALDLMQTVLHKAQRKLKGQAYTKELEYAELMKDTNEAINLSLIPKGRGLDKNGNLVWNTEESFRDIKRGHEIRKGYDNVGFEAIGVSDEHILALLDSPDIDYIIPNHSSGLAKRFADTAGTKGWKDYTKYQKWKRKGTGEAAGLDPEATAKELHREEVWDSLSSREKADLIEKFGGGKNPEAKARVHLGKLLWEKLDAKERQHRIDTAPVEIFVDEWKGDLNKLKELCEKRGVIPPFQQFANHKNYWKLLIDRRIFDKNGKFIEQKPLEFKFDMNYVKKMLDDYKGGHDVNQADAGIVKQFTSRTPEQIAATRMTTKDVQARKAAAKAAKQDTLTQMKEAAAKKLEGPKDFSVGRVDEPDMLTKMKSAAKRTLEETSGNTALDRKGPSAPALAWHNAGYVGKGKSVFDWGMGKGADMRFYNDKGAEAQGYDLNHQPNKPQGMADVVTSTYVANVLRPPARQSHLIEAYQRAKDKLLVSVRNEVGGKVIREEADGVVMMLKGEESFQKAFTQSELLDYLKKLFPSAEIVAGPRLSSGVTAVVKKKRSQGPQGVRSYLTGFSRGARRDKSPIGPPVFGDKEK